MTRECRGPNQPRVANIISENRDFRQYRLSSPKKNRESRPEKEQRHTREQTLQQGKTGYPRQIVRGDSHHNQNRVKGIHNQENRPQDHQHPFGIPGPRPDRDGGKSGEKRAGEANEEGNRIRIRHHEPPFGAGALHPDSDPGDTPKAAGAREQ